MNEHNPMAGANAPAGDDAKSSMNLPNAKSRPQGSQNSGVRNTVGGGTQRNQESDVKRNAKTYDPDLRFGAKGIMHQDIGDSICHQSGNDCS